MVATQVQFHFWSAKIFSRAFSAPAHRRFKSLVTFLLRCNKHKKLFCLHFYWLFFLLWVVPLFSKLECFAWKCHPRTDVNRKSQRWLPVVDGEISKRLQDFQCRVGYRDLKDTETQTEISIALSSPANSVSAAFLTALKLPERLLW